MCKSEYTHYASIYMHWVYEMDVLCTCFLKWIDALVDSNTNKMYCACRKWDLTADISMKNEKPRDWIELMNEFNIKNGNFVSCIWIFVVINPYYIDWIRWKMHLPVQQNHPIPNATSFSRTHPPNIEALCCVEESQCVYPEYTHPSCVLSLSLLQPLHNTHTISPTLSPHYQHIIRNTRLKMHKPRGPQRQHYSGAWRSIETLP